MSRSKLAASADHAVEAIPSGATVLVGGFGDSGVPFDLLAAVARRRPRNLVIVSNNCGTGERGIAELFRERLVSKILASFPVQPGDHHFRAALEEGETTIELVAQGTLVERLRAGAAGLGGILTPTGVGTMLAEAKSFEIDGRPMLLERPIRGDYALVRAAAADDVGNLRYRRSARNFNPVMAMAADVTIAQADRLLAVGDLDPDDVHTASPFVDFVVLTEAT